ncbi:flagellar biosynthetic protein FliO [Devosia lacusdianchii]|uniref:flagellar biosynthetic protein FliO n=1 Tax=Devosia lacusdianchii TaxID=2917991 RepID=UPI001F060D7A|nr:flagellar biosynthetic protein FliO [Devosia sp. JXJ CY 41]
MQFITSLIGGSGNTWLTALFALGIVVVLIVLGVWLLKLVFNASTSVARGRNRRLAVVDTLALDPKRQLLIIRRDNVEHLLLVGGPQDLVVEAGIPVEETQAAQPTRRPIPVVATRKPAPPVNPAAPAVVAPTPKAPAELPAAPATAIEKLREQGRPTNQRAHLSLRHTGLLRPVSESEALVSPENSGGQAAGGSDSAKEDSAQRDIEGTDVVEGNTEANRN